MFILLFHTERKLWNAPGHVVHRWANPLRMSITSSKHSSGLHFISCHRTDTYKHHNSSTDDVGISRMTIATSGSHLRGHGVNTMWVIAMWVGRVGEGKSHKSRAINHFLTLAGMYRLLAFFKQQCAETRQLNSKNSQCFTTPNHKKLGQYGKRK